MATERIERLKFNEHDMASAQSFARYEMEFIPSDDLDIETQVGDELKNVWDGIAKVASEGYAKYGRGYVFIQPNLIGYNRYSGQLAYDNECLKGAEVEYVTPNSQRYFYHHDYLEEYDPKTEVIFLIDFSDGRAVGITSFGKALNPKQAKAKSKSRKEN